MIFKFVYNLADFLEFDTFFYIYLKIRQIGLIFSKMMVKSVNLTNNFQVCSQSSWFPWVWHIFWHLLKNQSNFTNFLTFLNGKVGFNDDIEFVFSKTSKNTQHMCSLCFLGSPHQISVTVLIRPIRAFCYCFLTWIWRVDQSKQSG